MDYNSNRKKLVLPEYGRHIQQMVSHCVTIEDREERMRCAKTIIGIMGSMFPHLRDVSDFKHKLWDHLAIMADFKLDIDFPYEIPEPATFQTKPERVPYQNKKIKYMHYGRIVEELIQRAIVLEDEAERAHLVQMIANHMKKSLLVYNRDGATDERVMDDIKKFSGGQLIFEGEIRTPELREPSMNAGSISGMQHHRNNNRKKQFVKK
jgi:hypothetical protein